MPFKKDMKYAAEIGKAFGEYLITYQSEHGQVRADLFRPGKRVLAYVSFPTGLSASHVTDRYYSELWAYAREHGFAEDFEILLS
jgi:hypothetical protein